MLMVTIALGMCGEYPAVCTPREQPELWLWIMAGEQLDALGLREVS